MYVDGFKKIINEEKERKIDNFFRREELAGPMEEEVEEDDEIEMSRLNLKDVLFHWQAPEFEVYEKDRRWISYIALVLTAIIAYAVYTDSPIMAITFVLIGVVSYIYMHKEPRVLDFALTSEGIVAGREIYKFENVKSFWIFYEPDGTKVISLHTKSFLPPYVHIPIHEENPVELREIIMRYVPEIKQEKGMMDTLERLLRI